MIKKAVKMQLLKGCEKEYQKRHDEIWPEMVEMLKIHGVISYSIFLDPS
ncbi:L-rhamnose mutarotase, partial [Vibrio cholerae O1]|nr:L-rhamnose mutarotase [Vibrio cholerae O1]